MNNNNIVVERLIPVNRGNLQAFADVRLPDGTLIRGCRIVQQPTQAAWVSLPVTEWTDKAGQKRYTTVIELPSTISEQVTATLLAAWEGRV